MRCWKMSDRDVYERLEEIVPKRKLEDMDVIEVETSCKVAFQIIGYKLKAFDKSFQKAWKHSVATMLFEFIFDVYQEDKK